MSRLDRRIEKTAQEGPERPAYALDHAQVSDLLLELGKWDAPGLLRASTDSPDGFPWPDVAGMPEILADPRVYLGTMKDLALSAEDPRMASGALSAAAIVAKHVETGIFAARRISDEVLKGIATLKAVREMIASLGESHDASIRKIAKVCEHVIVNLEDRALARCMKLKPRDEERSIREAKR